MKAPERIWDYWPLDGGDPVLWRRPPPFPHDGEEVFEYIRLDAHQAALEAEREKAIRECLEAVKVKGTPNLAHPSRYQEVIEALLTKGDSHD